LCTYLLTKYITNAENIRTRLRPVSSQQALAVAECHRHWQDCHHRAVTCAEENAAGRDAVRHAAAATVWSWKYTGMTSPRCLEDGSLSAAAALAPVGTSLAAAAPQSLRSTNTASSHEYSI